MVLEFNRPATVATASAAPAEPVRIAQAAPAETASAQRFSLAEDAKALVAPTAEALPQTLPALNAAPEQVSAEQWLQGMLDQRELQVEAREEAPADEAELFADGAVAEPLESLWSNAASGLPAPVLLSGLNPRAQNTPQDAAPQFDSAALDEPELALSRAQLATGRESAGREFAAPVTTSVQSQAGLATPLNAALSAALPVELAAPIEGSSHTHSAQSPAAAADTGRLQQRLVLDAPQARWGEQMLQALRESVDVQLRQQVQSASIRLDPPELGSMEIFLSHESGRLNVQISASNGEVARLLQQTSDRLRQELVASNFLQVNVQVGSDGQSGRQSARPQAQWALDETVASNHNIGASEALSRAESSASDVLVTV